MDSDLGEWDNPAFPVTVFHAGLLYQTLRPEKRIFCATVESNANLVVERAGAGTFKFDPFVLDIISRARLTESNAYRLLEAAGNRVRADSLMLVVNTERIGNAKTLARQVADVLAENVFGTDLALLFITAASGACRT